jgi:peptide/nickel transport system ATP-binding protein
MSALLKVDDLVVTYRSSGTLGQWLSRQAAPSVHAVDGVSLRLSRGDSLGLVGESGCGKSTLGRAVLRLTPARSGKVLFDGKDVLTMRGAALMEFRRRAQMVFQDPFGSLNPRLTVFETLAEVLEVHDVCPSNQRRERVLSLMQQVGLSPALADRRGRALSGGQCQRVGIARALAIGAELIVADEPVSALDVSIQAQILNLLSQLQQRGNLTLLFIAHDLGVVRYLCQRVAVMYLGRIVEEGPVERVFDDPCHPYTRSLIEAIPSMIPDAGIPGQSIQGEPPSPRDRPDGCPFHPRCRQAMPECKSGSPPTVREALGRHVWCLLYPESTNTPRSGAIY